MLKLRQVRHDMNASWVKELRGWTPGDSTVHCRWFGVKCSDDGAHVTSL